MRIFRASILIGSLAVAGALPAALAQPVATAEPVRPARPGAPNAARDGYLQLCQTEMHDWKLRIERFSEKASASGQKEEQALDRDLNAAWAATEADAEKLRTTSAPDWGDAKLAYERSAQALTVAWDKIRPEDK